MARSQPPHHPAVVRHYCHLEGVLLLPGRTNSHHASELVSMHAPPKMSRSSGQEGKSRCRDSRNITISWWSAMVVFLITLQMWSKVRLRSYVSGINIKKKSVEYVLISDLMICIQCKDASLVCFLCAWQPFMLHETTAPSCGRLSVEHRAHCKVSVWLIVWIETT